MPKKVDTDRRSDRINVLSERCLCRPPAMAPAGSRASAARLRVAG
jgi:hypothetical protein